jgi:hypothetical protein
MVVSAIEAASSMAALWAVGGAGLEIGESIRDLFFVGCGATWSAVAALLAPAIVKTMLARAR